MLCTCFQGAADGGSEGLVWDVVTRWERKSSCYVHASKVPQTVSSGSLVWDVVTRWERECL